MKTELSVRKPDHATEADGPISIPLYASGLVVSVVGVIAVNSALSDDQFGSTTLFLTILGFLFSIACRWLRIKIRILETIATCLVAYFGYRYLTHTFSLSAFIPPDVTQGDLIMAIVLEWLTVIRAWALTNDESVVFTAVTSIAMIGLVGASNLNEELLIYFFIYMVFATFLLLHQTYLAQRAWISDSPGDESEAGVVKTQALLSVLSGFVALLVGIVVVIPLRAVGSHLSLATALKAFVGTQRGGDQVPQLTDAGVTLSDEDTFKIGTGSGDTASDQVMMRAVPSDGLEHYYRGRTYDVYQGNGWVSSLDGDVAILHSMPTPESPMLSAYILQPPQLAGGDHSQPQPAQGELTGNPVQTRFTLVGSSTSTLYVPYGTRQVDLPSGATANLRQSSDNYLGISNPEGSGFSYDAWSFGEDPTVVDLQRATPLTGNGPTPLMHEYIDQRGSDVVSPDDQLRLLETSRAILQTLPRNRQSEFDKAEAIRQWVSQRCIYSLNVDPVPPNDDAVSYFLFRTRRGYCDLFSSSMTILCRYAGIPARVATGFAPGEQSKHGGYDLRERDKHAWVEVWFPSYGWLEFDPTIGAVEDSSVSNPNFGDNWLKGELQRLRVFIRFGGLWSFVLQGLTGLAVLYVLKIEVFDRFLAARVMNRPGGLYRSLGDARKSADPLASISYSRNMMRSRYAQFENIMRRAGLRRLPTQTPQEYLTVVRAALLNGGVDSAELEQVSAAAELLTNEVMMASYAPMDLVGQSLVDSEEQRLGEAALMIMAERGAVIRRALSALQQNPAAR